MHPDPGPQWRACQGARQAQAMRTSTGGRAIAKPTAAHPAIVRTGTVSYHKGTCPAPYCALAKGHKLAHKVKLVAK